MSRGLSLLLVVLLAANLAVTGFVAGRALFGPGHFTARGPEAVGRGMPMRVIAELDALSPEARKVFEDTFKAQDRELRQRFRESRRLRRAVGAALAAEPYDRAAVEAAAAAFRDHEAETQGVLFGLMIDTFDDIPAADRALLVKAFDRQIERGFKGGGPGLRRGGPGGPPPGPPPGFEQDPPPPSDEG